MSRVTALRQASYHFDHKANYDRDQKLAAVVELAEWSYFSNRQIATFTGFDKNDIGPFTGKTDRTGGRFDGAALKPVLRIVEQGARGEVDDLAVARALKAGISSVMLSRFTGIAQTTLSARARRAA